MSTSFSVAVMSGLRVADHSQMHGVSQAKKRDLESLWGQTCDISAIAVVAQKARMHTTRKRIRRNAAKRLRQNRMFCPQAELRGEVCHLLYACKPFGFCY
jgi:hypothetical protein